MYLTFDLILQWTGFCKALFVEAKWYNKGYSPSLKEYLSHALISSGAIHSMLSVGSTDWKMINLLGKDEDLVYNISIITRLYNDLGTSMVIFFSRDPNSIMNFYNETKIIQWIVTGGERERGCTIINPLLHARNECFRERSWRTYQEHDQEYMEENKWAMFEERIT